MNLAARCPLLDLFVGTLFIQFIGGILYFIVLTNTGIVQFLYVTTKSFMLVMPFLLLFFGLQLPPFQLRKNVLQSLVYGMVSGVAISALILAVFVMFHSTFVLYAENILSKVIDVGILPYYLWAAIGMSLAHSLFEEYFWRWYVVRGLQTFISPQRALLIGAGLFALHHYIILSQFVPMGLTLLFGTCVGIGGWIWSWIYQKTDSVLGAWVSHAIVDATIFAIGYLLITG